MCVSFNFISGGFLNWKLIHSFNFCLLWDKVSLKQTNVIFKQRLCNKYQRGECIPQNSPCQWSSFLFQSDTEIKKIIIIIRVFKFQKKNTRYSNEKQITRHCSCTMTSTIKALWIHKNMYLINLYSFTWLSTSTLVQICTSNQTQRKVLRGLKLNFKLAQMACL